MEGCYRPLGLHCQTAGMSALAIARRICETRRLLFGRLIAPRLHFLAQLLSHAPHDHKCDSRSYAEAEADN